MPGNDHLGVQNQRAGVTTAESNYIETAALNVSLPPRHLSYWNIEKYYDAPRATLGRTD